MLPDFYFHKFQIVQFCNQISKYTWQNHFDFVVRGLYASPNQKQSSLQQNCEIIRIVKVNLRFSNESAEFRSCDFPIRFCVCKLLLRVVMRALAIINIKGLSNYGNVSSHQAYNIKLSVSEVLPNQKRRPAKGSALRCSFMKNGKLLSLWIFQLSWQTQTNTVNSFAGSSKIWNENQTQSRKSSNQDRQSAQSTTSFKARGYSTCYHGGDCPYFVHRAALGCARLPRIFANVYILLGIYTLANTQFFLI